VKKQKGKAMMQQEEIIEIEYFPEVEKGKEKTKK
jgi:hypothetical protein